MTSGVPRAATAGQSVGWALIVLGTVVTLVVGAAYIAAHAGTAPPQRDMFPLIGHLVVLTLVAGGLRRTGAALAILLGLASLPVLAVFGLAVLLDPHSGGGAALALCALGQLTLIAGGITDLRTIARHGLRPVPETRPWLALLGGLVLLVILIGNPFTRLAEYQQRRAQLAQVQAQKKLEQDYWARWYHYELNEMQQLAHCIERFRMASPDDAYPASLDELTSWARVTRVPYGACWDWLHANGDSTTWRLDPHHVVRYRPPTRPRRRDEFGGYTLAVDVGWAPGDEPRPAAPHGKWNYFLDTASLIHRTSERRSATAADSVAPICEAYAEVNGCQSPYPRRYRWGAGAVPVVAPAGYESLPAAVGTPSRTTFSFEPLVAADSVVAFEVAWGEDSSWTRVRVDGAHRPRRAGTKLLFDVEHVYRKATSYRVRFAVVTAGGERFESWRYLHVRD